MINPKIAKGLNYLAYGLIIALICILTIQFTTASVDLTTPANNSYTNKTIQPFEYIVSAFNATSCNLYIDLNLVQTSNSTSGFNQLNGTLTSGIHSWKINCSNTTDSQESQTRSITLDNVAPSVVLFTPNNGTTFTTQNITISFATFDTQSNELACNIKLDGLNEYSTIATSSQSMSIGLNSITDGTHNWSINCQDLANNSVTSEERLFSINTSQATQPFEFTLSNSNMIAGQSATFTINGPSGTNVRVEACPDINGFVECTVPLNLQNYTSYPITATIPFLNNENKYIIEAYFTNGNRSETKSAKYNVTSNIVINTDVTQRPRKNEIVKLDASATGGAGILTYTWILSNGSQINQRKTNITYTSSGNYTNKIVVKDQYNNSRNETVNIEVSDSYTIKFIVRDAQTQSNIKEATVSIDSQNKDTDLNGEAQVYVRAGTRDLTVFAQNYTAYLSELNITKDDTIVIALDKLNTVNQIPQIELIYPAEGDNIIGTSTELNFKITSKLQTNCSIYINDKDDNFYLDLGNKIVASNDNSIQKYGVIDLDNTKYWWKIECRDTTGKTGTSITKTFTVGEGQAIIQNTDSMTRYSDMAKEIDSIITSFETMNPELKETIELLGIKRDIEQRSRNIKNGLRDLESLSFKNLDANTYEVEKNKIDQKVQEAYNTAPNNFILEDSDGYVDYIQSSEIEDLIDEYVQILESNGTKLNVNKKKISSLLNDLQQEALISTKTRNVKVSYKDGTQKDLTVIIKELKTYNITDQTMLLENIPKSIAESADEIKSDNSIKIIKDDPIIEFNLKQGSVSPNNKELKIVYYFEKKIELSNLRDIKTSLFLDDILSAQGKSSDFKLLSLLTGLTGFTIKSKNYAIPNWNIALIILIIGFSLISRISTKSGGIGLHSIKYAAYLAKKGDTTHYIKVILNDIKDNLQAGYIEKAIMLYEEAKVAYNDLPTIAKNDVYDQVIETANLISQTQNITTNNMPLQKIIIKIENAEKTLIESQLTDAINIYKEIEQDYHMLDEKTKETIHPRVIDLINKINVIAESNKSRYNQ